MKELIMLALCGFILAFAIWGAFKAVIVEEQAACAYYTSPQKPLWCQLRESELSKN